MSTFVSVGNANQPFCRLIDAVIAIVDELPGPVMIQHGHTPARTAAGVTLVERMEMEAFSREVAKAELLIMHAGAGSLIHAIQAGKVPVVMPRRAEKGEHIDDHQLELAAALVQEKRIVVAQGPEDLAKAVQQARKLQATGSETVQKEAALVQRVSALLDELADA